MKKSKLTYIALLFCISNLFSQEITGVVLNKKNNLPLEGATIYFDNTTKGTISNSKGFFSLDFDRSLNTPLIVSFLGYKKKTVTNYNSNTPLKIYLEEDVSALSEVFLSSEDEWSRAYKLNQFKTHFLGVSENAKSCKILNEDALVLKFIKSEKQLVAIAKKPLIIVNNNLKYQINYELQDFEVKYTSDGDAGPYIATSVYYAGTSYYKSEGDDKQRILKRRGKVYKGSVLHFMRALLKGKLKDQGYRIIYDKRDVPPENFISIYATDNPLIYKVRLFKPLIVVYDNNVSRQSSIKTLGTYFYIDSYGNHSPVNEVIFTGHFGNQRMGDTLPLDYESNF